LRVAFSPQYSFHLGTHHQFPMAKYRAVHDLLLAEGTILPEDVMPAPAVTETELRRVHTADYVSRFLTGELSAAEQRRLGFPWTSALRERALHATGGTLVAARAALEDGLAANLAGGSHHAFPGHGEGYCAFHDMAIAIRALRAEGRERRVAVIDCDVHQGNGTAALFAEDPAVFTFSIHCESNYPARKVPGTRDVGLANGVGDDEYLYRLETELEDLWERFQPELVFYQSGVDPLADDRLGRLTLSAEGLRRRDRAVLGRCVARGVPAVVTMGGGYGRTLNDTVEAHASVIRTACALASGREPVLPERERQPAR
jgi:acetoin utilization deacetylase AcuC-like enzyme